MRCSSPDRCATAPPPPFGPAANGAVYYSVNGDLMAADSPIATPRTILGGDTFDNGALLSPDGTRMVFVRGDIGSTQAQLWTAASDGSKPRKLADVPTIGWAEWSPQSDTVAVLLERSPSKILLVDADTGSTTEIDSGLAAVQSLIWRPPDGAQLTMRGRRDATTERWGIYVLARDGTGLQRLDLDPGYESDPYYNDNWDYYFQSPTWSADGTRLLYQQLEPDPISPEGPGFRNHVATIDADGAVTDDRMIEFDILVDDEFAGSWLSEDSILYQTVEGGEHRLLVGSVADGQASGRDLGVTANDWIPYSVSPDTRSAIVSLPGRQRPSGTSFRWISRLASRRRRHSVPTTSAGSAWHPHPEPGYANSGLGRRRSRPDRRPRKPTVRTSPKPSSGAARGVPRAARGRSRCCASGTPGRSAPRWGEPACGPGTRGTRTAPAPAARPITPARA